MIALPLLLTLATATPTVAAAPGARERDGFFLRLAIGGAGLAMKRDGSLSGGGNRYYLGSSRIEGGGSLSEISIGGTLAPGLVLAGSLLSFSHDDPVLDHEDEADVKLPGPLQFILLGPTLEYFPDPRGGFHVGATLGIAGAWVEAPEPRFTKYLGGAGGGLSLSAGYHFWVSDQWSLGVVLRAVAARIHGEDTQLGITGSEDDDVTALGLMFSGTYH